MRKILLFFILFLILFYFSHAFGAGEKRVIPVYHHHYETTYTIIYETQVIPVPAEKYIGIDVKIDTITKEVFLTGINTGTVLVIPGGIKAKVK